MWSVELQRVCGARITHFREAARVQHVFLLDQDGHVLSHAGHGDHIDIYSMAALLASLTAASSGVARLLEASFFREAYYEGQETNLFSLRLPSGHIIGALFNKRETTLGLVRLRARQTAEQVALDLDEHSQDTRRSLSLSHLEERDIDQLLEGL